MLVCRVYSRVRENTNQIGPKDKKMLKMTKNEKYVSYWLVIMHTYMMEHIYHFQVDLICFQTFLLSVNSIIRDQNYKN